MIRTGLIGKDIQHSLSPKIHNSGFDFFNIEGKYELFDIDITQIDGLLMDNRISGYSVTMPYKEFIYKKLKKNLTKNASILKSVNTIYRNNENKWVGENTDYFGFEYVFRKNFLNKIDTNDSIAVLGNGGSVNSILGVLSSYNFSNINLFVRDIKKAKSKINSLSFSNKEFINFFHINIDNLSEIINNSTFLINALPEAFWMSNRLNNIKTKLIFDILYDPCPTWLEKAISVKSKDSIFVNGLPMLIMQGIKQFELFTGKIIPPEIIFEKFNLIDSN